MSRYGRLTVEGWISQHGDDGHVYINATPDDSDGIEWGQGVIYSGIKPTIEYLPAPVVFNDGDVVRWKLLGEVGVRVAGEWRITAADGRDVSSAMIHEAWVAQCLTTGAAVRLVAEQVSS